MEPIKAFVFLFSLTLCVSQLAYQIEGDESHVEEVCQQTQNKESCIAAFATNTDSKTASLRQLGIIALKIAAKNATETSVYIEKTLNSTNVEPEFQQELSDCLEEYIDANEQIDNSVAALLSKADADIQTWLNAALSGIKTCDDSIPANYTNASFLKKRNADFRQLCNNALVIAKLLAQHKIHLQIN